MPGKIFISYRRDDAAGDARSIYQRLQRTFGAKRLFMDVDSIQRGRDFQDALDAHLDESEVMLAIIGPRWMEAKNADGRRRLDEDHDLVRIEIATALRRDIAVIPVLFGGGRIPKESELPDDLKPLARRQGIAVTHESFARDMDSLERDIQAVVGSGTSRSRIGVGAAILMALILAAGVTAHFLGVPIRVPWSTSGDNAAARQGGSVGDPEAQGRREKNPADADNIVGTWTSEPNMGEIRIIHGNSGQYLLINLNPLSMSMTVGETIGEVRFQGLSKQWNYVGRHMWGGTKTKDSHWGEAEQLVINSLSANELFMSYLDSQHTAGWRLRRK